MRQSISVDSTILDQYKGYAKKFGVTLTELIDHSLFQHHRAALATRKHATRIVLNYKKAKGVPKKKKAAKKEKAVVKKKAAPVTALTVAAA